ncbi:DUF4435 domain-containing protein [Scopulibacillus cellulosilyticus]|uniref:DUF4435 domain-containing protein n=1 Tax=Scopulibacillus cellulosilyticus TaxID=2665665 RepID=A0ABW2PUE2_9BACL
MNSLPIHNDISKLALSKLYSSYNDITIYVEDEKIVHAYLKLFNELFKNELKIKRVFSLKGKGNIIRALKSYRSNQISLPSPCFFIVDQDLDPFLEIENLEDELLIYLKEYCIENYLIEEVAVLRALQWKLCLPIEELGNIVQFQKWLNEISLAFLPLFIAFIICRKHKLGENVQLSPYKFIEDNGYKVDNKKVEKYINKLRQKYVQKGIGSIERFEDEYEYINVLIQELEAPFFKCLISGKYLLASLLRYVKKISKKSIDEDFFFGHLVENFDISKFQFIKDHILKLVFN